MPGFGFGSVRAARRNRLLGGVALPSFSFGTASISQAEGNSGVTHFQIPVLRAGDTSVADTVTISMLSGTADAADFVGGIVPNGVALPFPVGSALEYLDIQINADTVNENDETAVLEITDVSRGTIGSPSVVTLTITDDDTIPQLPALVNNTYRLVYTPSLENFGGYTGPLMQIGFNGATFDVPQLASKKIDTAAALAWWAGRPGGGDYAGQFPTVEKIYTHNGGFTGDLVAISGVAKPVLDPNLIPADGLWAPSFNGYSARQNDASGNALPVSEANTAMQIETGASANSNTGNFSVALILEAVPNIGVAAAGSPNQNMIFGMKAASNANNFQFMSGDSDWSQHYGYGVQRGTATRTFPASQLHALMNRHLVLISCSTAQTINGVAGPVTNVRVNGDVNQEWTFPSGQTSNSTSGVANWLKIGTDAIGTANVGTNFVLQGMIVFGNCLVTAADGDQRGVVEQALLDAYNIVKNDEYQHQINAFGSSSIGPGGYRANAGGGIIARLPALLSDLKVAVESYGMAGSSLISAQEPNKTSLAATRRTSFPGKKLMFEMNSRNDLNGNAAPAAILTATNSFVNAFSAWDGRIVGGIWHSVKGGGYTNNGGTQGAWTTDENSVGDGIVANAAANNYVARDLRALLPDYNDHSKIDDQIHTSEAGGGPLVSANIAAIAREMIAPPVLGDLSLSTQTVADSASTGAVVGVVQGLFSGARGAAAMALSNDGGGKFALNTSTGELTVAASLSGPTSNYDIPITLAHSYPGSATVYTVVQIHVAVSANPFEPVSLLSSFTVAGETFTIWDSQTRGAGNPVALPICYDPNGQPIIYSDPAGATTYYLDVTTASSQINGYWANGMEEDPWHATGQGGDEILAGGNQDGNSARISWVPSKNICPGYTGVRIPITPGMNKSFVKWLRRSGVTAPLNGGTEYRHFSDYAVFHVLGTRLPLGGFAPAACALDKTVKYTKAGRNLAALGSGFTLPASHPTLATLKNSNYLHYWHPYVGVSGAQQRRLRVHQGALGSPSLNVITDGYVGGIGGWMHRMGQVFNAMMAAGEAGYDEETLNRFTGLAIQVEAESIRSGNAVRSKGAGMHGEYSPACQLLVHLYHAQDATLAARMRAIKSNTLNQNKWASAAEVGRPTPWPGNHGVQCSTLHTEDAAKPIYDGNDYDTSLDADYQFVSSPGGMAEILGISALRSGPNGWNGRQVLANHATDFSITNSLAAPLAYYDRVRTWRQDDYYLKPYDDAERDLYDLHSAGWTKWTGTPDPVTPTSDKSPTGTSHYLSAAGAGAIRFNTTSAQNASQTITARRKQYSYDMRYYKDFASQGADETITGLVPGMPTYFREARQSAAGWGPPSENFARKTSPGATTELGTRMSMTATGTPSGAVSWIDDPVVLIKTYPGWSGGLFDAAPSTIDLDHDTTLYATIGIPTGAFTNSPTWQWYRDGAPISGATLDFYPFLSTDLGHDIHYTCTLNGVTRTSNTVSLPARPAQPAGTLIDATFDSNLFNVLYPLTAASGERTASGGLSNASISDARFDLTIFLSPDGLSILANGSWRFFKNGQWPVANIDLTADFGATSGVAYDVLVDLLIPKTYSKKLNWSLGSTVGGSDYGSGQIDPASQTKPFLAPISRSVTPTGTKIYLSLAPQSSTGGTESGNHDVFVVDASVKDAHSGEILPVGATFAWVGDGLVAPSGGVESGTANMVHRFMELMGGRVQPVPIPNLGMSGTTIKTVSGSNRPWIYPYAIDAAASQVPDIFVIGTMGANDKVLSTNPGADASSGATTSTWLQDWYDAVDYSYTKFAAYDGGLFVVIPTCSSTKTNESTYRPTIWAAMQAHVAAMTASDSRVLFADITDMTDPTLWSVDSGSSYVHLDERGAYHVASAVKTAIDARIESKTSDEIMDMIVAGTYPLMSGSQLDSDVGLAGSGGTVTGPGITGTLATTKAVSNTTGATGITVAQVSTSGGRTKTVLTLAGTASGDGKILLQDKSSISVSATPGQYIRTGFMVRASAGYRNAGSEWNNNAGGWGGGATSLINNGKAGANQTVALDALIINGSVISTNGTLNFNSSTTFSGKRSFGVFYKSGVTLSGTIEMERPFTYKWSNRTAAAPAYLGNIGNDTGSTLLLGSNYRLRPSGTVTNAGGGTVRAEPGCWNLAGLTEADFTERRIYAGGGSGGITNTSNIGAGTLLATLSGSTWTYAVGAGALTAGTLLYVEIDCNNGIGGTVTRRSSATLTVG